MNETTQTQLKILVERAVRPVRAGVGCKRKMRQELLAHVTDAFGDEMKRLGDEQAALEQTARRFGNPAELTAKLQESVPAKDRVKRIIDQLLFRRGESWLAGAFRIAILLEAMFVTHLGATYLLYRVVVGRWPTPKSPALRWELVGFFSLMLFGASLSQWIMPFNAARRRCWWDILLFFAICVAAALALFVPFGRAGNGRSFIYIMIQLNVANLGYMFMSTLRRRYFDEWERLEIN